MRKAPSGKFDVEVAGGKKEENSLVLQYILAASTQRAQRFLGAFRRHVTDKEEPNQKRPKFFFADRAKNILLCNWVIHPSCTKSEGTSFLRQERCGLVPDWCILMWLPQCVGPTLSELFGLSGVSRSKASIAVFFSSSSSWQRNIDFKDCRYL